ncbi:MAG: 23S rRNA (guanosine(2251)-2'-O)-methyltransferase RlmB [Patescibacteria group bacterium]
MKQAKTYIYGKHALREALTFAPHIVKKIMVAPSFDDNSIRALIKKCGFPISEFSPNKMTVGFDGRVDKDAAHQGIIAQINPSELVLDYKKFIDNLKVTKDTSLIILGELQDTHNVGAIIRSAAAFGVAGVLMPEHNQAPVTGTVVKVSAGMSFRIPLITVPNVNTAMRDLKEKGFWIYGLDGSATQSVTTEKFDAPAVFILGNEGEGIRQKTRELCDILLSIPMNPQCESLNVAASAAVTLYSWSAQHPEALK